jgi:hypothetical protein
MGKTSITSMKRCIALNEATTAFRLFNFSRTNGEKNCITPARTVNAEICPHSLSSAPIYFKKPAKNAPVVKPNIIRAEILSIIA